MRRRGLSACGWVLSGAALLAVTPAAAQEPAHAPAVFAHPEPTEAERAQLRRATAWISARLEAETPASQRWYWFWTVVPLTAGVAQGVAAAVLVAPGVATQSIIDNWVPGFVVGSATSLAGVLPQLFLPFSPAFSAGRLRRARNLSDSARLALAERLLREDAEGEEMGRSWWVHLLGWGLAAGGAVAVLGWMNWGQRADTAVNAWFSAGLQLVTTGVVAELSIFTQPLGATHAWRAYQRSLGDVPAGVPRASRWRAVPLFSPSSAGFALLF